MESRFSLAPLLILVGIGYLLANLNIIPITPWQAFVAYWPALLLFFGIKGLLIWSMQANKGRHPDGNELFGHLFLILIGLFLLAPRVGWGIRPLSWGVIWPILLIIVGVIHLFKNDLSLFQFVGEIHRSGQSWALDDMNLRHGIGEIHLDLTQAIIPNREVNIDIRGLVGEVTIYTPNDLPLKAHCSTSIGEISVLDQHLDGLGRTLNFQSADYENAQRKLNLTIQWKIGEIKVRRIG